MKRCILVFAVGAALLLSSACSTKTADPRVSVISPLLVKILQVETRANDAGFLEVQVTGKNTTTDYKKLEYRVEWLDGKGFSLPSTLTRWTPVPAFGGSEFRFRATAGHKAARDFRLLIRKGN